MLSGNEVGDIISKAFGCAVFVVIAALVIAGVTGYAVGTIAHTNNNPKVSAQPQ